MSQKESTSYLPFNSDEYNNVHLNGSNDTYQKYIILTFPRTGSNHLVSYLRSHNQIISFAELFQRSQVWFNYDGYPRYNSETLISYRNKNVVDFLNNMIFRKFAQEISAVGFKLFYDQPAHIPGGEIILNYLKNLKDLKIIHLKRKNVFRAYVSLKVALKTNEWVVYGKTNSKLPNSEINPTYENCLFFFKFVKENMKFYESFFKDSHHLEIFYEDLVGNPKIALSKIQEFLNVEQFDLKSLCKKQASASLPSYVSNFFELKKMFSGTEFEQYFEEE